MRKAALARLMAVGSGFSGRGDKALGGGFWWDRSCVKHSRRAGKCFEAAGMLDLEEMRGADSAYECGKAVEGSAVAGTGTGEGRGPKAMGRLLGGMALSRAGNSRLGKKKQQQKPHNKSSTKGQSGVKRKAGKRRRQSAGIFPGLAHREGWQFVSLFQPEERQTPPKAHLCFSRACWGGVWLAPAPWVGSMGMGKAAG